MIGVVKPYVAGVLEGGDWFDDVVFLRGKAWQDGTAAAASSCAVRTSTWPCCSPTRFAPP